MSIGDSPGAAIIVTGVSLQEPGSPPPVWAAPGIAAFGEAAFGAACAGAGRRTTAAVATDAPPPPEVVCGVGLSVGAAACDEASCWNPGPITSAVLTVPAGTILRVASC